MHSNIHTETGYTNCEHRPIFKDSCYEEAPEIGVLSWIPPQSCSSPERYEVLYTQTGCSASNAATERIELTNLTSINLQSADLLCVKVRAVFGVSQSCYSFYSICAQVASLKHGMYCAHMPLVTHSLDEKYLVYQTFLNDYRFHLPQCTLEIGSVLAKRVDWGEVKANVCCAHGISCSYTAAVSVELNVF